MQRLQAYKYELMPIEAQKRCMNRFAGLCRLVYNKALALQKERYDADKTIRFSYTMLANLLPAWKREPAWLKRSPAQTLQQSLKDLERTYANFFAKRRAGHAQLACEVNPAVRGQQQEPAEVIQLSFAECGSNPLALARGGCQLCC